MNKRAMLLTAIASMKKELQEQKPPEDFWIFSGRVSNLLMRNNILSIDDLLLKTEEDVLSIKYMGARGLDEIKIMLEEQGKKLKSLSLFPDDELPTIGFRGNKKIIINNGEQR